MHINRFVYGSRFPAGIALLLAATIAAHAEAKPSLDCEMKMQRACEAAIWAMPAVSVYDIEKVG